MTLRLKRGTDEQRLAIVFEEGELVYTIDTKKLYVGDGSTQGGVEVSSNGIINDTTPQLGGDLDLNEYNIIGNGSIDINGDITALSVSATLLSEDSALAFNPATGVFSGTFEGDLQGSLFSNSSTLLVNAVNGEVNANTFKPLSSFINITNTSGGPRLTIQFQSFDARPRHIYRSILTGTTTSRNDPEEQWMQVLVQCEDDSGIATSAAINGGPNHISIGHSSTGNFGTSVFTYFKDGKLGVGKEPTEKLEVEGNIKTSGFIQFGSFSSVERDNLVAVNGMVLYNSTLNRFQGYQNGSWINLDDGTVSS